MSVPFRDLREEDGLGVAGYLRFVTEQQGNGIQGALFLVNARGEPVDFAFSRIDVPGSFLWRNGESKRRSIASLAAVLFQACPKTPSVLFCLAEEVDPRIFGDDLYVEIPLCRVTETGNSPYATSESMEALTDGLHLFWVTQSPLAESPARQMVSALQGRQLITEPFERTIQGLEEAFRA